MLHQSNLHRADNPVQIYWDVQECKQGKWMSLDSSSNNSLEDAKKIFDEAVQKHPQLYFRIAPSGTS